MNKRFFLPLAFLSLTAYSAGGARAVNKAASENDPYLWLEEIEGERALDFVRRENVRSEKSLSEGEPYASIHRVIHANLTAKDKIPYVSYQNGKLLNFWQDATHVRGIWRQTTFSEYAKPEPKWETILDLDALAKAENENWVWHGADCLGPRFERCLLSLSRGGKDADVVREFDFATKSFVEGGFTLPEAKSSSAWVDADTLLTASDFGPGTLTSSGYPRQLKIWKRGGSAERGTLIFEGKESDMSVGPMRLEDVKGEVHLFVSRRPTFFESENWILGADRKSLTKVPVPLDSEIQGIFKGQLLVRLRSEWQSHPAGALVSLPIQKLDAPPALVYAPGPRQSFEEVAPSQAGLFLKVNDKVRGELHRFDFRDGQWTRTRLPVPEQGTLSVVSYGAEHDVVLFDFEGFLEPTGLYRLENGQPKILRQLPKRFDSQGMRVEQFEAKSKDGTLVPYFLVRKAGARAEGPVPTLLYGYGGFEVSLTPFYLPSIGKVWLEKGGAYALANIRGGGEFGAAWHQAALKTNRHRAFEDFEAIAEDLRARKVTTPAKLGIMGGSNGGLLMGAVFTRRPELFGAAVVQVPLLDMLRYNQLLAGASWMGEYGDPADPKEGAALRAYSPYQNVSKERKYPKIFFTTSTKDDRVHPGHARKMMARMKEQGHDVLYYENIEGGHGGAANLEQKAKMSALEYSFLYRTLFGAE